MAGLPGLRRQGRRVLGSAAVQDVLLGVVSSVVAVWILTQVFAGVALTAGSVTLRVSVVPSLNGGLTVQAPPLGNLSADSFVAPARLVARAESVDVGAIEPLLSGSPTPTFEVPDTVDLARVIGSAVLLDAAAAALFGGVVAVTLRLRPSRVSRVAATGAAVVVSVGFLGLLTHDASAYDEPQRTGAWAALPELTSEALSGGAVQGAFGEQLTRFGSTLTGFYAALTADARASGLRGGSEVVLVIPEGLPDAVLTAAREWFQPDLVTGPTDTSVPDLDAVDGGLLLPDGRLAPLALTNGTDSLTARFVVLYLDPETDQLRAVDLVTLDGEAATLERLALDPERAS